MEKTILRKSLHNGRIARAGRQNNLFYPVGFQQGYGL
jgi:hypothetical protein